MILSSTRSNNRKLALIVAIVILVSLIVGSVLANSFGVFSTVHESGSKTLQQHFDGASAAGTIVQTSDGGYFLVGETANSTSIPYSACIIHTDPDGHSIWSQTNQTLSSIKEGLGFVLYSIAKTAGGKYFVTGYLGGVGITVEEIKDNGQPLCVGSFGVSSQSPTEPISGNVIGVDMQGGYAWAGYSGGSIWLIETYWYTP